MELEKLQKIIAEVLNVDTEEVTWDTTFVDDLGADSLDIFQIVMGIEEEFDIEIPTEEAEQIVSVGDAVEQIKNDNRIKSEMSSRKIRSVLIKGGHFCIIKKENKGADMKNSKKFVELEKKIGYEFRKF